ncbi:hypothetical protein [Cellulomonas sp. Y8]|uniref:hypothetical protein n=1 Tax=Cellulomonas sp. Y8 TaxID=2591145 RepID=UPI0011C9C230|nr:hypothetical protein [Cellulomonas sp. Y8]
MDSATPAAARTAAARAVAGPLLAIALVAGAGVAALWPAVLGLPPDLMCPAVLPVPWWCSAGGARAHGLRLTGALLAAAAGAAALAVLLGRRWPRAAWLLPLAVGAAGWAAHAAAAP